MRIVPPLVAAIIGLTAWQAAVHLQNSAILPAPADVGERWLVLIGDPVYYASIASTLALTLGGLSIGVLVGIGVGITTSLTKWIRLALVPYVHAIRALPAVAFIPVVLALAPGDLGRPLIIGVACSAIIATSFDDGFRSVTTERLEFADSARLRGWRRAALLYMPEVGRHLLIGVRIATGLALVLAVVLEMLLGAHRGLGVYLSTYADTDRALSFVAVITLAVIGVGLNLAVTKLSDRIIYWRD